jgi:hypothetical protein
LGGEDVFDGDDHAVEGREGLAQYLGWAMQTEDVDLVESGLQPILLLPAFKTTALSAVANLRVKPNSLLKRLHWCLMAESFLVGHFEQTEGVVGVVQDDSVVEDGTLPSILLVLQQGQLLLNAVI